MKTAKEIIELVKTAQSHMYEIRGDHGQKLLTLSWRPGKGFRYFRGKRSGGGGRKHTPCSEEAAIELIEKTMKES